jgi:anthraniloyl-CoA monooxygenase
MFRARGCDLAHVITGIVGFEGRPRYDAYASTLHSDRVRNEAGISTLLAVRSATTDEINGILAAGRGDLCLLPPLRSDAGDCA